MVFKPYPVHFEREMCTKRSKVTIRNRESYATHKNVKTALHRSFVAVDMPSGTMVSLCLFVRSIERW
jgi:hypothetical protein